MYYSAKRNAAYDHPSNYLDFPDDAVEISDQVYHDIFIARPMGKLVSPDANGYPKLIDMPEPTGSQLAEIKRRERDRQLREVYDVGIIRAKREERLGADVSDRISVLDAYAIALLDVPQQPGFPTEIQWPDIPDA